MRPATQPDGTIVPDFDFSRANASNIRAAFKNRGYTSAITTFPTSPTNGSSLIIATLLVTTKSSGIFMAGATVATTGDTAAGTLDYQIGIQFVAATPVITLANAVAVGPHASVSNAAAGIVVTNGGASVLQFDSGSQVLPTGGTTNVFNWSGLTSGSPNNAGEVTEALGVQALFTLSLNTSAAVTFRGLSFWAVEQPA